MRSRVVSTRYFLEISLPPILRFTIVKRDKSFAVERFFCSSVNLPGLSSVLCKYVSMFYDQGNVLNRITQTFSLGSRRKLEGKKSEPTLFPINYRCEFITDVFEGIYGQNVCPYFLGYNLLAYKSLKVICDSKLEI